MRTIKSLFCAVGLLLCLVGTNYAQTGIVTGEVKFQAGIGAAQQTKTGAYTLTSSDTVILADTSSAGFTLTLPTAASATTRVYTIRKTSSSNTLTIIVSGGGTIDGSASLAFTAQSAYTLTSNGTEWKAIASFGVSSGAAVTDYFNAINVTKTPYSCVGDGVANDTACIAAAITAAAAAGGAVVKLPAGTYLVTGLTVPGGVTLVGDGKEKTIIKSATNGVILDLVAGSGTWAFLGPKIRDLWVDGSDAGASQVGIRATDASSVRDVVITDVTISDCGSHGLSLGNVFSSEFRNIYSTSNQGYAFFYNSSNMPSNYFYGLYAGDISSTSPAGYRIKAGIFVCWSCNGINSVPGATGYWGVIGGAAGDIDGDLTASFASATFRDCNIEGGKTAGLLVYPGSVPTLSGETSFVGLTASSGSYVAIQYDTDASLFPENARRGYIEDSVVFANSPASFYANSQPISSDGLPPLEVNGRGPRIAGGAFIATYYNTATSRAEVLNRVDGYQPTINITTSTSFTNPGGRFYRVNCAGNCSLTLPSPVYYDTGNEFVTVLNISTTGVIVTINANGGAAVNGGSYTLTVQNQAVTLFPDFTSLDWRVISNRIGAGSANFYALYDAANNVTSTGSLLQNSGTDLVTTGDFLFSPDNTLDIGTASDVRPRAIYAGTSVTVPRVFYGGGSASTTAGSATPEGAVTAEPGSMYLRTNGSWYIKSSGSGNTGWAVAGTGGGTVTSVGASFTGGLVSISGSPISTSGTLGFTVAGTSGGIPYFSSSSTWASSAALTANLPVIGGGAGTAPTVGARSGNTTSFATTTGTLTSGRLAEWDASGNLVQSSITATTLSPGGTTNSIQINSGAGLFDGGANALLDLASSTITLGTSLSQNGRIQLRNTTNTNVTNLIAGAPSTNITLTLLATLPVAAGCLEVSSTGTITQTGSACTVGGTPGGSDTQVQRNNAGAFGAITTMTSDGTLVAFAPTVTTGTGATAGVRGTANSLTTGNAFEFSSSSATSGNLMSLAITGTAATTNDTVLNVSNSGATSTNAQTTYGVKVGNTRTNATSGTNVGLQVTASGATTDNIALMIGTGTASQEQINTNLSGSLDPNIFFTNGVINFRTSGGTTDYFYFSQSTLSLGGSLTMGWASGSSTSGTNDTGFERDAANVVRVTNGSTGAGGLLIGSSSATGQVGTFVLAGSVRSSGAPAPPIIQILDGADTGLSPQEQINYQFGGDSSQATVTRTLNSSGGTVTTWRNEVHVAPTFAAGAATTITNAYATTFDSIQAGSNVTLTTSTAVRIKPSATTHHGLFADGQVSHTGDPVRIGLAGSAVVRFNAAGGTINSVFNDNGALSASATDGFPYISRVDSASALSGTPTGYNGSSPCLLRNNTANSQYTLQCYINSVWRDMSMPLGENSPAQITGDQNNYNAGVPTKLQRWNTDASHQITGLTFNVTQQAGQEHTICNVGSTDIVLVHASGSSTAANRFATTDTLNITIVGQQCAQVVYDGTTQRWRAALWN